MKNKWLTIGIILLFIGVSVPVVGNSVQKETKVLQNILKIERTPSDGVYWNDCKIAEYPVLYYLHYYFKIKAAIPIVITITAEGNESINRVEFYINDLLMSTVVGPGPTCTFPFNVPVTPFHHSPTFGIKVYLNGGKILNDNVTIYRLFP